MKLVKHRGFLVWNFDKEEDWLNQMANDGWVLKKVGFLRYEFEQSEPKDQTIRMELLDYSPTSDKGQDYLEFLKDTGVEHIDSYWKWVYLRKPTALGTFDLFSDRDSRINHLNRISKFIAGFALLELGFGLFSSMTSSSGADIGSIIIIIGLFFVYGYYRIKQKKTALEQERNLFE